MDSDSPLISTFPIFEQPCSTLSCMKPTRSVVFACFYGLPCFLSTVPFSKRLLHCGLTREGWGYQLPSYCGTTNQEESVFRRLVLVFYQQLSYLGLFPRLSCLCYRVGWFSTQFPLQGSPLVMNFMEPKAGAYHLFSFDPSVTGFSIGFLKHCLRDSDTHALPR